MYVTCKFTTDFPGTKARRVRVMALLNHHKGWMCLRNKSTNLRRPRPVNTQLSFSKSNSSAAAADST